MLPLNDEDFADRHLIFGERARLVGADDRGAAERFNCRKAAHQRMALDHSLDADGERNGDHSGQSLGNDGNRQRDAENQHRDEGLTTEQAEGDNNRHDHKSGSCQHVPDPVQVFLQRSLAGLDRLQHLGNLAKLGAHAGSIGHCLAGAVERFGSAFLEIASYESFNSLKGAGNSSESRQYVFIDPSVFNNIVYWYRLTDVSIQGIRTYHPVISVTPTAPDEGLIPDTQIHNKMPKQIALLQNYPNPFNPVTKICLLISGTDEAISFLDLSIYDIKGQKVKTLFSGSIQPPIGEFEWDGKNESGEPVAGGIYFYTLKTPNTIQSRKMVLLR